MSRTRHDVLRPSTALLALAAVAALAGCADPALPGAAATAPGTSAAPGDGTVAPSPAATSQAVTPAEGGASTSTAADRCRTADLEGSLASDPGRTTGGQASTDDTEVTIVLTNTGRSACTLQGWPGVSFVGGGDGTQLGAAADRDIVSLPHDTVVLRAGGEADVLVVVGSATDWSDVQCDPQDADGFRVYPPGEAHALFVEGDFTACTDAAVPLLTVNAVQPG